MATTLVLGGTRSGETRYARQLLPAQEPVTVVNAGGKGATEGSSRDVHGPREPLTAGPQWNVVDTVEVTRTILRGRTPVLIDCLGTWVAGLLNEWDGWNDPSSSATRAEEAAYELAALWANAPYDAVALSHEVGMAPLPRNDRQRIYQDLLGRVNTIMSEASQRTHLLIAGRVLDLSNAPLVH